LKNVWILCQNLLRTAKKVILDYFNHNSPGERARELFKISMHWAKHSSFDCRIETFQKIETRKLAESKTLFLIAMS